MTDFLSRLDSADPASVPGLCLLYADYLSERGEPCEGWRALGMRRHQPFYYHPILREWLWHWCDSVCWGGAAHPDSELADEWFERVSHGFPSRSSALAAAAQAFEGLADEVKREILDSAKGVMA